MIRHTKFLCILAGSAAAALLAACSSSGAGDSGAGSSRAEPQAPSPAGTSAASESSAGQANAITDYVAYVGGKPGKANGQLDPVSIGWINGQGGPTDLAPEATDGAKAAVAFLNDNAGGINGHPVKLVACAVPGTVSGASACGQQMANNKDVIAVGTGAVQVGTAAMESALAPKKKPLLFNFASTARDASYDPGFVLFGSTFTTEAPFAVVAGVLHADSVTLLYRQVPGVQGEIDNILAGFKAANIKVLHTVGYSANATDLISALSASRYRDAGLIVWPEGSVSGCSAIYKAIQTLSVKVPVATAVPCNAPQVAVADGGSLPEGWYYLSATNIYDPSTPEGSAFLKVMTQFGKPKLAGDAWVEDSFSQVLTIAKWYGSVLSAGKPLTPANVAAAGKADKSGVPFGPPHFDCGVYSSAGLPNLCSKEALFVQYTKGKFVKVGKGWYGPPDGYSPVVS